MFVRRPVLHSLWFLEDTRVRLNGRMPRTDQAGWVLKGTLIYATPTKQSRPGKTGLENQRKWVSYELHPLLRILIAYRHVDRVQVEPCLRHGYDVVDERPGWGEVLIDEQARLVGAGHDLRLLRRGKSPIRHDQSGRRPPGPDPERTKERLQALRRRTAEKNAEMREKVRHLRRRSEVGDTE